MSVDGRLAECRWPDLPAPYDAALREATADVFEVAEPIGIIATGTIIRGTAHAASDLDVYVIHVRCISSPHSAILSWSARGDFHQPAARGSIVLSEEHRMRVRSLRT